MKTLTSKLALALLGASLIGGSAFAAPADAPAPNDAPKKAGRAPRDPAKQAERLAKQLELTDAQKTAVKAIFEEQKTKVEALTGQERRAKMRELREETDTKINALLTDAQKTKWAELKEQMKNRAKEGRGKKDKAEAPAANA